MNWKLLLIVLSLFISDISSRPADETQPTAEALSAKIESTTNGKVKPEVTNLTEKPTTLSQPQPTKQPPIEVTTKRNVEKIITTEAAIVTSTTSHQVPTTTRYLHPTSQSLQSIKNTNAHKTKYANNYSNLITKHTLLNNKRFVNNTASNITVVNNEFNLNSSSDSNGGNANKNSLNNNSLYLRTTTESNEMPSLPSFATISSAVNSNSSSKPLLFIDADGFAPITKYADPTTSTTKRAFVALNSNPIGGSWSTYQSYFDDTKATPITIRKKPVIHKIISKWSDNPNEVFNFHNESPLMPSQHSQINAIKNQLVQSIYNPPNSVLSFENLPTIIGQQILHQQQHMPDKISDTPQILPSSTSSHSPPAVSDLILLKKKPISNNIDEDLFDRCREVRIKLGTSINGKISSAEEGECKGLNIHIDNKIDNTNLQTLATVNDYDMPNNDKYEDPPTEELYDAGLNDVDTLGNQIGKPGILKDDEETNKKKKTKSKKNKKKQGDISGSQIEEESETEEETTTTEMSSMMMTVVTMMAIFNPLNFGVWGLLLAPVAAMTLGGAVFAMYHFSNNQNKPSHQVWHDPWPKPQEIIVKNKINHSPIPIKITHHHKHTTAPQKVIYTHPPVVEYAPPWHSAPSPVKNSYGEPPTDNYYPSAPSGDGPYRRKTFPQKNRQQPQRIKHRRPSNPFRYKLL